MTFDKTSNLPSWFTKTLLAVLLLPLVPALYFTFSETWIAKDFIEWQVSWTGGYYYLKVTVLFVYGFLLLSFVLVPLLIVLLVVLLVKKVILRK